MTADLLSSTCVGTTHCALALIPVTTFNRKLCHAQVSHMDIITVWLHTLTEPVKLLGVTGCVYTGIQNVYF
ncbi:hypothetical protein XELAEV_18005476mg [Xenopus laevis]|uniref:Uncharacterized protein n=1 Tax=Xenopus laevis TaxID=8355 RepID=A0A974I397_XENLA|nr:hypothetical protein XELAEV_18005476mg [Xenopus laevis]